LAIISVFATQKLQQMLEKTLLWRIYLRDNEDFYAWRLFFDLFHHHSAAYSAIWLPATDLLFNFTQSSSINITKWLLWLLS